MFGDKDSDGFYQGKCLERTGYIPCNMVSELHIESEEVRMQLLRQGHLTSASLLIDLGKLSSYFLHLPSTDYSIWCNLSIMHSIITFFNVAP